MLKSFTLNKHFKRCNNIRLFSKFSFFCNRNLIDAHSLFKFLKHIFRLFQNAFWLSFFNLKKFLKKFFFDSSTWSKKGNYQISVFKLRHDISLLGHIAAILTEARFYLNVATYFNLNFKSKQILEDAICMKKNYCFRNFWNYNQEKILAMKVLSE